MRSVISVAGVLAAVGPAMAVPQQYTGFYPQPNGTTTTTPYGTGYYPPHSSTTTYLTTRTTTSTTTNTHTLTITPSTDSPGNGSPGTHTVHNTVYTTVQAQGIAPQGSVCEGGETVTVTSKEKITVTVTASSAEEHYPTTASLEQQQVTVKHPHSHFHSHHSHHHSPVTVIPTQYPTSIPMTSSTEAPATHSTHAPPPPPSSTTSKSHPTQTYTPAPAGGKRGISYNDAADCTPFDSSSVSWAYNWLSSPDGLTGDFQYVPMLWGNRDDFTSTWATNVAAAIKAGATEVMSFNEPDLPEQANMDPNTACSVFKTYFNDLAGQVRIGAPSVTNGAAPMGLAWLSSFMEACSDAPIDFVSVHWYDAASNVQYFKDHVTQAHQQSGKPVWVTEFGATGSDEEISAFLEDVMGWMEEQDFVEKYAYFMASDGYLLSGTSLSAIGSTYVSA